ncbi:shikimate kinase [Nocardioides ochotonae]|uniref:shikimate kinase n=1 Tax=Nocardioides ochotonae TaxID=2685869 RepID=UPI0014090A06|nr:shikimate kinase [Nocardioides ochotonae]
MAASGKTTIGRALSRRLSLPLLDKDDILESLLDSLGCFGREQRYRLSRASDEVLYRLARSSPAAVLVNWWDHDTAPERLRAISASLVEVFCDCPVELAATRFAARERHPGHLDRLRTPYDVEESVRGMRASFRGPLGLNDAPVVVDTSRPVDLDNLVERVRAATSPDGLAAPGT